MHGIMHAFESAGFYAALAGALVAVLAFAVACLGKGAAVRIAAAVVMALGLAVASTAYGAPPPGANGQFSEWFSGLKDRDGRGCCDLSDCRMVRVRYTRKGYEVLITPETHDIAEATWIEVPDGKVIKPETGNPTGRAVVCWLPHAGVLCFVPPPEV